MFFYDRKKSLLGIIVIGIVVVFLHTTSNQVSAEPNYAPRWETVKVCQTAGCGTTFTGTFTPTENSSAQLFVEGVYTDQNGCLDVTTSNDALSIYLKRGNVTCAARTDADDRYCYAGFSSTTPACSSVCDTGSPTGTISCAFDIRWIADATDVGDYTTQQWSATLNAKDIASVSAASSTAGFEMGTLNALNLSTSTFSFGTLAVAATSTDVSFNVINTGNNNALDLTFSATDLSCSQVGAIAASQIKMATNSGFFYETKYVTLNNSSQSLTNFDLAKTTATSTGGTASSTLYFQLVMPYAVGGNCNGSISVNGQ